MPRRAKLQLAFSKGVLDPGLGERIDLVHYWQGVRDGRNVEWLPQGGFTRRAPTRNTYPVRMRRRLEPVALTAAMVTAHNGGTAAYLVDQDAATEFTTASAVSGSTFVVAEIDMGATYSVAAVDLEGFYCESGRWDNGFGVEWWTGTTWVAFGGPDDLTLYKQTHLRTTKRTRRFAYAPGIAASTQHLRVVVYGAPSIGTITIGDMKVWRELGMAATNGRVLAFQRSDTETYQHVMCDWNIDIFRNGSYVGSVPVGLPCEMNRLIKHEQSQDTLLLFHEDMPTPQIQRQGTDDEWDATPYVYADVPDVTVSTSFSGAEDEMQEVTLAGYAAGQTLYAMLGNRRTASWVSAGAASLGSELIAALTGLSGVSASGISAAVLATSPPRVSLTFVGSNGSRAWPRVIVRSVGSATVSAVADVVRRGMPESGSAPLIGETTGYPRCGKVMQARMIVGGMRAAPQSLLFSRAGDPTNFLIEADPMTADLGLLHTFDTGSVETINDIFVGRHLQIFTSTGDWWSDNRTIDATQPFNVILATRYGVAQDVPLAMAEGATLFVESGGRTLRDFLYADVSQNYEAEPLSLLAPHLITRAIGMTYRRAVTTSDCNKVLLPDASGGIAALCLMRRQEIVAWSPWTFAHAIVSDAATDVTNTTYLVMQRSGDLWLEHLAPGGLLDGAVDADVGALGSITGLPSYMNGRQVWALVNGDVEGPYTVAGGATMLSATSGVATIGFDIDVLVGGLDFREKLDQGQPFRPPVRIYESEIAVVDTGHLEFAANGGPYEEVPLRHVDGEPDPSRETGDEPAADLMDTAMMDRLYTGRVLVEQLDGWTETGRWSLRQSRPAPLTVRSVRLELSMRG